MFEDVVQDPGLQDGFPWMKMLSQQHPKHPGLTQVPASYGLSFSFVVFECLGRSARCRLLCGINEIIMYVHGVGFLVWPCRPRFYKSNLEQVHFSATTQMNAI